jgi:hypothetical protein
VRKILRWGIIAVAVVGVGIQFVRPERTNPPIDPALDVERFLYVEPEVAALLRTACYDCHSNETKWPWYSNVAPSSWLLARDVNDGRRHLNFSNWGIYPTGRQVNTLESIAEEVLEENMPYPPYLLLHPEARIDSAQRNTIIQWARRESDRLSGDE